MYLINFIKNRSIASAAAITLPSIITLCVKAVNNKINIGLIGNSKLKASTDSTFKHLQNILTTTCGWVLHPKLLIVRLLAIIISDGILSMQIL